LILNLTCLLAITLAEKHKFKTPQDVKNNKLPIKLVYNKDHKILSLSYMWTWIWKTTADPFINEEARLQYLSGIITTKIEGSRTLAVTALSASPNRWQDKDDWIHNYYYCFQVNATCLPPHRDLKETKQRFLQCI